MNYDLLINKILKNRLGNLSDLEIQKHKEAKYENLSDPFLLPHIDKAIEIFLEAISENYKIFVYADYDADGIPGSVILADFFDQIGFKNYFIYLPDRLREGYGMKEEVVRKIAEENYKLLITIDLGITEVENIKLAKKLGLKIIVTDHHEPLEELPPADAIINPKLGNYPDKMICGAGTIFQFLRAMIKKNNFNLFLGYEKWWLDLVGLATLSDMVPLVKDNRIFAKWGMLVLNKKKRPAFNVLLQEKKIKMATEEDITFGITPKINAASRIGHPIEAFKWLASKNIQQAKNNLEILIQRDEERKKETKSSYQKIQTILKNRKNKNIIVVGKTDIHPGILSLLAGKLVEKHKKPVFVWTESGDKEIKGSCRSVGEISVLQMLNTLPVGFLKHFGGHHLAAGFSLDKNNIHFLEENLEKVYELLGYTEALGTDLSADFVFDEELKLKDINEILFNLIKDFGPYGQGYQKPLFIFKNLKAVKINYFGKDKEHLRITVSEDDCLRQFIQFFYEGKKIEKGEIVNIISSIEKDELGYGDTYFGQIKNLQKI